MIPARSWSLPSVGDTSSTFTCLSCTGSDAVVDELREVLGLVGREPALPAGDLDVALEARRLHFGRGLDDAVEGDRDGTVPAGVARRRRLVELLRRELVERGVAVAGHLHHDDIALAGLELALRAVDTLPGEGRRTEEVPHLAHRARATPRTCRGGRRRPSSSGSRGARRSLRCHRMRPRPWPRRPTPEVPSWWWSTRAWWSRSRRRPGGGRRRGRGRRGLGRGRQLGEHRAEAQLGGATDDPLRRGRGPSRRGGRRRCRCPGE